MFEAVAKMDAGAGQWVFPCEVEDAVVVRGESDVVYNLVLDDKGTEVTVSGRVCVTLGHGSCGLSARAGLSRT